MRVFIFIAALIFAVPAFAEDADMITLCNLLPAYQPSDNVEYVPGVDVKGQPVVSADINDGSGFRQFESIEIPVEVDLIQKFGVNAPVGVDLKPMVALISIHKDGKVDYNGQDVSKQAHALCNKAKQ